MIFTEANPAGISGIKDLGASGAARLAMLIRQAGVQPAVLALRAIQSQHIQLPSSWKVIPAFFQESRRLAHAPIQEQHRMLDEHRRMQPGNQHSPAGFQAINRRVRYPPGPLDPGKSREELKEMFPDRRSPRKPVGNKPGRRAGLQDIQEFLRSNLQDILPAVQESASITVVPGKSVTLTGGERVELRVERDPSGRVGQTAGAYWTGNPYLPELWDHGNRQSWTTRGLGAQQAARAAAGWLAAEWQGQDPLPGQNALAGICLEELRDRGTNDGPNDGTNDGPNDGELSRELREGLMTLFDQETLDLARSATGKFNVRLSQYNIAVLGAREINRLLEHNPAALAWCMLQETQESSRQTFQHPGQIVQAARAGLEKIGVEPRYWRHIRQLGMNVMSALLELPSRETAIALSILGEGRILPGYAQTEALMRTIRRMPEIREMPAPQSELTNLRNRAALIRLYPWRPDDHHQREFENTLGYVNQMTREGMRVRSMSWKGLKARSDRWRREMRQQELREQWENLIERRGGWSHAWNSLLGETRLEGLSFIPLTDERQLLQESLRMSTCIFSYGEHAAAGRSRLFGVQRDREPDATPDATLDATLEITLQDGAWEATQVRGPRNQPVEPDIELAAETLAEQYNQAWRLNPRHQAWREQE